VVGPGDGVLIEFPTLRSIATDERGDLVLLTHLMKSVESSTETGPEIRNRSSIDVVRRTFLDRHRPSTSVTRAWRTSARRRECLRRLTGRG